MIVVKLKNGKLRIPVRLVGPDGMTGDGSDDIGPEHPDYQAWLKDVNAEENKDGKIVGIQK